MYDHPPIPALHWKKQKTFVPHPPKHNKNGSQSARKSRNTPRPSSRFRHRRYRKMDPMAIYKSLTKHCHTGIDQIHVARTLEALKESSYRVHHHKSLWPLQPDTEYMQKNHHSKIPVLIQKEYPKSYEKEIHDVTLNMLLDAKKTKKQTENAYRQGPWHLSGLETVTRRQNEGINSQTHYLAHDMSAITSKLGIFPKTARWPISKRNTNENALSEIGWNKSRWPLVANKGPKYEFDRGNNNQFRRSLWDHSPGPGSYFANVLHNDLIAPPGGKRGTFGSSKRSENASNDKRHKIRRRGDMQVIDRSLPEYKSQHQKRMEYKQFHKTLRKEENVQMARMRRRIRRRHKQRQMVHNGGTSHLYAEKFQKMDDQDRHGKHLWFTVIYGLKIYKTFENIHAEQCQKRYEALRQRCLARTVVDNLKNLRLKSVARKTRRRTEIERAQIFSVHHISERMAKNKAADVIFSQLGGLVVSTKSKFCQAVMRAKKRFAPARMTARESQVWQSKNIRYLKMRDKIKGLIRNLCEIRQARILLFVKQIERAEIEVCYITFSGFTIGFV